MTGATGPVVVGIFDDVERAAAGARALRAIPLPESGLTAISAAPLPDGAVVADRRPIRFPWVVALFWFVGALGGLALTLVSYLEYPLITAGKPIASVPPAIIVTYEAAMLGALLATLVAGFRAIGLGRIRARKVFDPAIHEGKIVLCARVGTPEEERRAIEAMQGAGGTRVRAEEGEL